MALGGSDISGVVGVAAIVVASFGYNGLGEDNEGKTVVGAVGVIRVKVCLNFNDLGRTILILFPFCMCADGWKSPPCRPEWKHPWPQNGNIHQRSLRNSAKRFFKMQTRGKYMGVYALCAPTLYNHSRLRLHADPRQNVSTPFPQSIETWLFPDFCKGVDMQHGAPPLRRWEGETSCYCSFALLSP